MTILTKVILGLAAILFLIWHPVTRRIILVILPLGKGWDDILFWVLLVLLGLVVFIKGWVNLTKIKKFFQRIEQEESQNE